jgi:hypothetical protein
MSLLDDFLLEISNVVVDFVLFYLLFVDRHFQIVDDGVNIRPLAEVCLSDL